MSLPSRQPDNHADRSVDDRLVAIVTGRVLQKQLGIHARAAGVRDAEFLLLWACYRASGQNQRELADRLGMSTAQLSGLVEGLRSRGLLACRRAEMDRRRQEWTLTDSGGALVVQVRDAWASADSQFRATDGKGVAA